MRDAGLYTAFEYKGIIRHPFWETGIKKSEVNRFVEKGINNRKSYSNLISI